MLMPAMRTAMPRAVQVAVCRAALAAVWALGIGAGLAGPSARAAGFAGVGEGFTDRHCSACHNDVDREAGLDLTGLKFEPADPANLLAWIGVHDRVASGEMPPPDRRQPLPADRSNFLEKLSGSLMAAEKEIVAREGRAVRRRLNRAEYENALRDLLHAPWLQVKDQLPEDGEAYRFNKISDALDVSYVHLSRTMQAADYALRQAIGVQLVRPPTSLKRYYARDERSLTGFQPEIDVNAGPPDRHKFPVVGSTAQPEVRAYRAPLTAGETNPEIREQEAIGWTSSNYVTGFASGWENFKAPVAGRYRLRFSGYTLWAAPGGHGRTFAHGRDRVGVDQPPQWYLPNYDRISPGRRDEPITVYSKGGIMNRRLGEFDLTPEPVVRQIDEVWLMANERIVTDASRFFRSRPTGYQGGFTNPLAQRDGVPAVAFRWMEVEGPLYDENTAAGYRLLFGELPVREVPAGGRGVQVDVVAAPRNRLVRQGGYAPMGGAPAPEFSQVVVTTVEVESADPAGDADRLLRSFMARAYRRPVTEAGVQLFLRLIHQRLDAGLGFAGAMLAGYTAVLASPEFVYVDEQPGRLDDHALATRLALFLWNSQPDAALRARAARGELGRPEVLKAEITRMLADDRTDRFVEAFLDYWLEIRRREETTPSTSLYNDYYLDDALTEAALAETRLFFGDLLQRDLPARNLVDADFTFLNERLGRHYGMPEIEGIAMRRVALPADSVRGGFMTQASVLKVTANGTTTSPVTRGRWILERIMGEEIPAPPAAVPAVEPDIRGAVTIRQQLDRHRADESCAGCHRKIDPPGFALESFDVLGGWRDRYRASALDAAPEPGFGKNGWPYAFHLALPVDPAGEMPDGRRFEDIRDFKRLLLEDETQIARNLARQLSIYATGSPVRFSDRGTIERMVESTKSSEYGVRSLVEAIVLSDLFRHK